jgi:predicted DNA-binding transcriptional regulator AlpA
MGVVRLLTTSEVAAVCGVGVSTIAAYHHRGQMPEPDQRYGRTPLWLASTIVLWRPETANAIDALEERA